MYRLKIGFFIGFIGIIQMATPVHGQRRSDLMAEIDSLLIRLSTTEDSLNQSIKQQKASKTMADAYAAQVTELKDANATLLRNLGNFAEVSNKNTAALNQALSSLASKEDELRKIISELTRHDSLIIALLSDAKQTLGPDARVKVAGGSVVISQSLEVLFGKDTGSSVVSASENWITAVTGLLNNHPEMQVTVEGLSMIGDLSLAAVQATAVLNSLKKNEALKNRSILVTGRDGNFSEGIDIVLHPDYRKFYYTVKGEMQR
ncbi:MAG: hypothetical protein RLZZ241_1862 [Bacteroidota bacterium]|jgi:esterase/lipase